MFHPGTITPYLEFLALVKVQAQIIVQTDVSRGGQALEIHVCHFADITPTLFKVSSIDPSTLFFFGKGVLDSFYAFAYEF